MRGFKDRLFAAATLVLFLTFFVGAQAGQEVFSATSPVKIHYIDVGQADSILIQDNGKNMLIDAGNAADGDLVVSYLKKQGVKKLDYLFFSHGHEDHIGGGVEVVKTFKANKILMPKVTANTQTFKNLLLAIKGKGEKITATTAGMKFNLGKASFLVLAPNSANYEDMNNYSIVLKMSYGKTSYLFQGDAEELSESEILSKGFDVSADVIKISHHGSRSSSSNSYLAAATNKLRFAIISCGKDNDYGHPHKETLGKLNARNIKIYRTDLQGTIVSTTDGKNISFKTGGGTSVSKSAVPPKKTVTGGTASKSGKQIVYVTRTGEKYHADGCRYLSRSKIPMSLDDAIGSGYAPCSVCGPPTK